MSDYQPEYRVLETAAGFEPQIKYLVRDRERWFALLPSGFWADPDEWNEDESATRLIVASRAKAEQAILRARSINRDNFQLVR
jgi:hypothetical protein